MMATGAKVSDVATAPKIARVVDPVAGLTDEFMSGLSAYRAAYQALKGLGGSAAG
jgi:xylulokinase